MGAGVVSGPLRKIGDERRTNMKNDDLAAKIEAYFLADGKWELAVIPDGHPICTPGRWLELSDANYSFRPIDLANAING